MSRVVVMLKSRCIFFCRELECNQTSFRALLKSDSAAGEGQKLLLRATVLAVEWGSQISGRYCRDLREAENAINQELSESCGMRQFEHPL